MAEKFLNEVEEELITAPRKLSASSEQANGTLTPRVPQYKQRLEEDTYYRFMISLEKLAIRVKLRSILVEDPIAKIDKTINEVKDISEKIGSTSSYISLTLILVQQRELRAMIKALQCMIKN